MTTLSSLPAVAATGSEPDPAAAHEAEVALVRAAVGGSGRAFEDLVRLHQRRVYYFLFQMTRHREDAEDLTQQTFLKAYRHLDRVDGNRPIINWLLTIARRSALNHFRAAKKWESADEELASAAPTPAQSVEQKDRTEHLWARARRVLSQREFEVMWLRYGEDLSIEETARVMELTQIHVKVIVHRARQHLLKGELHP